MTNIGMEKYKELIFEAEDVKKRLHELQKALLNIQEKFGSLKLNHEIRLKNAKIEYNNKLEELKGFMANTKEYNRLKDLYEKQYIERVGVINRGFHTAERNLMKKGKVLNDQIKRMTGKDLLGKAYQAFKKIPYKKTTAAVTAGTGALVAAATYRRYRNLEKQRSERLNKSKVNSKF